MREKITYTVAGLLVGPVSGRIIGLIPVIVPAIVAVWIWILAGAEFVSVLLLVISAPAFIAAAFIIHEAGHLAVFHALGLKGGLTYSPPVDLRSVPRGAKVKHSTGTRLIARAIGGWLINVVAVFTLVLVMLMVDLSLRWLMMLSWAILWQGVSALTATAWAAHAPLTDAASLARAVAVRDDVKVIRSFSGAIELDVVIQRKTHLVHPREFDDRWWLFISGARDVVARGPRVMVLPYESDEALVQVRSNEDRFALQVRFVPTDDRVEAVSRGGTIIDLSLH